jgi:hypothetical protein
MEGNYESKLVYLPLMVFGYMPITHISNSIQLSKDSCNFIIIRWANTPLYAFSHSIHALLVPIHRLSHLIISARAKSEKLSETRSSGPLPHITRGKPITQSPSPTRPNTPSPHTNRTTHPPLQIETPSPMTRLTSPRLPIPTVHRPPFIKARAFHRIKRILIRIKSNKLITLEDLTADIFIHSRKPFFVRVFIFVARVRFAEAFHFFQVPNWDGACSGDDA